MNENKNNENTKDVKETDTSKNMDYSFDFANQVEEDANNTVVTPADATTTTPEATSVSENSNTQNTIADVSNTTTTTSNVAPDTTAGVTNTTTDASNTTNATGAEANADVTTTPVTPATSENDQAEDSESLIQDKKATKRFLIILFVVVLIFIILLPFISDFLG